MASLEGWRICLSLLLTAGVLTAIGQAFYTSATAAAARRRELRGLLRLISMEIKSNNRSAEMLLHKPELITHAPEEAFMDDAWRETRVRLAQLLPNEQHFDALNIYYINTAATREAAVRAAANEVDTSDLTRPLSQTLRESIESQRHDGLILGRMILQYIPDAEVRQDSLEQIDREIEQQRRQPLEDQ